MIVSIHQPNYLPWTTLIHKIASSDIFVVFDDVQLVRGKSFVIRTRIKTIGGIKWLTVPVKNKSSLLNINQIELNNEIDWAKKQCNTIKSNYRNTEYFLNYYELFESALMEKTEKLIQLNVSLLKIILDILEIKTKIVMSSELIIKNNGTEKIIEILKSLNTKQFLSGIGKGSSKYTIGKENLYEREGIDVIYQKFVTPQYSQLFDEFIPDLSIIDMLFNMGKEKTQEIIYAEKNNLKRYEN